MVLEWSLCFILYVLKICKVGKCFLFQKWWEQAVLVWLLRCSSRFPSFSLRFEGFQIGKAKHHLAHVQRSASFPSILAQLRCFEQLVLFFFLKERHNAFLILAKANKTSSSFLIFALLYAAHPSPFSFSQLLWFILFLFWKKK